MLDLELEKMNLMLVSEAGIQSKEAIEGQVSNTEAAPLRLVDFHASESVRPLCQVS